MKLFYFALNTGRRFVPECEGLELPDDEAARHHAVAVAREIMRNREPGTYSWRIQVCDDYLQPLFEVLFADASEWVSSLPGDFRVSIQLVARKAAALYDALIETQAAIAGLNKTLEEADNILTSFSGRKS